jgi:hypothetical protein
MEQGEIARVHREMTREVQCRGNGGYIRANYSPEKPWTYGTARLRAFWKRSEVTEHIAHGFEDEFPVMAQMLRWKCRSGQFAIQARSATASGVDRHEVSLICRRRWIPADSNHKNGAGFEWTLHR